MLNQKSRKYKNNENMKRNIKIVKGLRALRFKNPKS